MSSLLRNLGFAVTAIVVSQTAHAGTIVSGRQAVQLATSMRADAMYGLRMQQSIEAIVLDPAHHYSRAYVYAVQTGAPNFTVLKIIEGYQLVDGVGPARFEVEWSAWRRDRAPIQ